MEKEIGKYVLTQDTFSAVRQLTGGENTRALKMEIDIYFEKIVSLVSSSFPKSEVSIVPFFEDEINSRLETKVTEYLKTNPGLICVCFDRFLLESLEANYPDRFFRLQVTRSVSGEKTARQGSFPIVSQIDTLVSFLGNRDLILVDDGVFTGGTYKYIVAELQKRGIEKARIKKFIGFIGDKAKLNGSVIESIEPIDNMFEWIDTRDFGLFGGKKFEASKNNFVSTSIPYVFPWSNGSGASFDKLENFYEISSEMIVAFKTLIESIEIVQGKKLIIKDLVKTGFAIPTNSKNTIPITLNTKISDYLDQCLKIIEEVQK